MGKHTAAIQQAKRGTTDQRDTLVSAKHLEWLLGYVETLGVSKMAEMGVARGGCIALCSLANPQLTVIGCDSWQGMPAITQEDDAGVCRKWVGKKWASVEDVHRTYAAHGASTENLMLLEGWFEDTVPKNIGRFDGLDILRIDSDFYASVKYCLDTLYDKVKPGGLVIFDDWHFNRKGVAAAYNDFLAANGIAVESVPIQVHEARGPAYFFKPK